MPRKLKRKGRKKRTSTLRQKQKQAININIDSNNRSGARPSEQKQQQIPAYSGVQPRVISNPSSNLNGVENLIKALTKLSTDNKDAANKPVPPPVPAPAPAMGGYVQNFDGFGRVPVRNSRDSQLERRYESWWTEGDSSGVISDSDSNRDTSAWRDTAGEEEDDIVIQSTRDTIRRPESESSSRARMIEIINNRQTRVAELRDLAGQLQITLPPRITKSELRDLLLSHLQA